MCCGLKKQAEKVTKKKLKITVKQCSVFFLVYSGRFALHLDRTTIGKNTFFVFVGEKVKQTKCGRFEEFSCVLNFV